MYFKNEQDYKMFRIDELKKTLGANAYCIETEETEPGFPDVLFVFKKLHIANFFEFKYADSSGYITFKKTQPVFYKRNKELTINVLAWDPVAKREHWFLVEELFEKDSPYRMDTNRKVKLPR